VSPDRELPVPFLDNDLSCMDGLNEFPYSSSNVLLIVRDGNSCSAVLSAVSSRRRARGVRPSGGPPGFRCAGPENPRNKKGSDQKRFVSPRHGSKSSVLGGNGWENRSTQPPPAQNRASRTLSRPGQSHWRRHRAPLRPVSAREASFSWSGKVPSPTPIPPFL
jgi:hypothetical protein